MLRLTEQLHGEHTELQQALAGIRPRLFRTTEGQQRVSRVRDLFRTHTATENDKLYPVLNSAAREDERIAARVRRMQDDLGIVSELAEGFFAKYEKGPPSLIEFATDHGALVTILKIRLQREEETLFPLYEKLAEN